MPPSKRGAGQCQIINPLGLGTRGSYCASWVWKSPLVTLGESFWLIDLAASWAPICPSSDADASPARKRPLPSELMFAVPTSGLWSVLVRACRTASSA